MVAAARRRPGRSLVVAGVAVLAVAVVAATTLLVLPDEVHLTFQGRSIDRPEATLSAAEANLRSIVDSRHGATGDQSRCYFSLPAGDGSDINDYLRCGPVLFVDGDPDQPYLTFSLSVPPQGAGGSGETVRLVPADLPRSPDPGDLDDGERLRRPDGARPPDGAGGLQPPPPPRADAGLLAIDDLEGLDLSDPGPEARIGSWALSYRLVGMAQPDRFGQGDDARRPAVGERFVVARIETAPGEATAEPLPPRPALTIQVGDGPPRAVPQALSSAAIGMPVGLVMSVPEATGWVELIVSEMGVEQRLSLLTGEPDPANISVLRRQHRSQELDARAGLTFSAAAPGRAPQSFTVDVSVPEVDLYWFFGRDGQLHPTGTDRAYLVPDTHFGWDPALGLDDGTSLEPPAFSLELPDGSVIPATNLAAAGQVLVAFDVPADFTSGTLVVGGRYTGTDGVTIDFGTSALRVPIAIPAG